MTQFYLMPSNLPVRRQNVKIVFLKEAPPPRHLYDMEELNRTANAKQKILQRNLQRQSLHTSIPYLSSILQDSTQIRDTPQLSEQCSVAVKTQPQEPAQVHFSLYKTRYLKSNERYLSELLSNYSRKQRTVNTEGIQRLIEERKVMPVDKLRLGRKNITLSHKNKTELSKDFSEFVEEKKRSFSMGPDENPRKTAAFVIKRQRPRRKVHSIKTEPIQQINKDRGVSFLTGLKEFDDRPVSETNWQEERAAKLSVQSVATGIQAIKNFRWSKLSKMPFRLAK